MGHFRALFSISSANELSPKVLLAMACLEEEIRIVGAVSVARKAKSLVQRWLAKAVDIVTPDTGESDALAANDIIIERDTIVIVKVKVGKGAATANVSCSYHVIDIYEKYYNKWFMHKESQKKWKKESKKYKLKV